MEGKLNKNMVLIIAFIFLIIVGLIGTLFYVNLSNRETITTDAVVTYVGNHYILVKDGDSLEYSLTTDQEYQVGDKVRFTMKNVKKDSYPKEGTVEKIDVISKSVEFQVKDSQEDSTSNQKPEESDTSKTEENSTSKGNSGNVTGSTNEGNSTNSSNDDVVTYFETVNRNLDSYSQDKSLSSSIKSGFVTIVDFLFYGQPIKGKTFSELSTTAKLKVLKLAFSIDKKIDEHFPGYKEEISNTGSKIYTNVKSKAIEAYLNVTTKVCTNDPDTCAAAKEGLSDLKASFSLTWDFIKEIGGVGLSKLKAWYEVWRDC